MIGQFFTPDVVARAMLKWSRVAAGQRVIDPSCGDGVFLRNAPADADVFGCEIDPAYHANLDALVGAARAVKDDALTALRPQWGTFDVVIGNPPFSAQAHLERRREVLREFDLGAGKRSECLEVLFLELFLKLAKPGGRIAIILPDGPLSNKPFARVRAWLLRHAHVEAIVSLPRNIFSVATAAKTSVLVVQHRPAANEPYREPTGLHVCDDLARIEEIDLQDAGGAAAVLADLSDWRPEAQPHVHSPAAGGGVAGETVRLGDVFRLRTGFARYGAQRALLDAPAADRILLLRAKNLRPEGGLRLDADVAYVETAGPMFREKAVLAAGEIVFVRVGVGCYGRTAFVPPGFRAQADDWFIVFTPLMQLDVPAFVGWMNGLEARAELRRLAKGVGTLSISRPSLAEMKIPARFVSGDLNREARPA
ncbi:MAG TPA: N-6 DNA methylase [Opitutaceae bacterium]